MSVIYSIRQDLWTRLNTALPISASLEPLAAVNRRVMRVRDPVQARVNDLVEWECVNNTPYVAEVSSAVKQVLEALCLKV